MGPPISIHDASDLLSQAISKRIKVKAIPSSITCLAAYALNPFVPTMTDMAAMFRWFNPSKYIADTTRQTELFGTSSTAEDAISRLGLNLIRDT